MNDQRDRERFHRAIDRTMGSVTGDPFLHTRVMAAARKKEGEKNMKFNKVLIIAMAAMLLCVTVAAASELLNGILSWDGTLLPDDHVAPLPTQVVTMAATEEAVNRNTLAHAFMEANPPKDGETVLYYDTQDGDQPMGWYTLAQNVSDMDEFAALVGDSIILPGSIPDGYVLTEGRILYGCREGGEFRLVEMVESEDGFRAEQYTIDEKDRVVIGYELFFHREDAENWLNVPNLYVYANLRSVQHGETAMSVSDVVEVRTAQVPGMDKAVAAQGAERCHLVMYATLAEGVIVRADVLEEAETCFTVDYTVYGAPSAEEMLAMFGGK